jgi:hypothetical protein
MGVCLTSESPLLFLCRVFGMEGGLEDRNANNFSNQDELTMKTIRKNQGQLRAIFRPPHSYLHANSRAANRSQYSQL